jgi:hypothetical protein
LPVAAPAAARELIHCIFDSYWMLPATANENTKTAA